MKKSTTSKARRVSAEKKAPVMNMKMMKKESPARPMLVGAAVLLILSLLYFNKGLFFAASVNGNLISRPGIIKNLEQHYGAATLEKLVSQIIIEQGLTKAKITVSDAEVNEEVKKIEASVTQQGKQLPDLLKQQGLTMQDLRDQLKVQKGVEKLFAGKVKVSDKEVADYIEKNQDTIPSEMSQADIEKNVKDQLSREKLNQEFQKWFDAEKKAAKINNFVSY